MLLASTLLRGSPVHAGHLLGGTAQSMRRDRVASSQEGEGHSYWESEASRAAVHNASDVVAAATWVGTRHPRQPHSSFDWSVGVNDMWPLFSRLKAGRDISAASFQSWLCFCGASTGV
eukprot:366192-Chlamydomonas_euryale.AAC.8